MLRMGKNTKDQTESEQTTDSQTTQYNASRSTYTPSYQSSEPQYRPQGDSASSSRAVTESESLARDIRAERGDQPAVFQQQLKLNRLPP